MCSFWAIQSVQKCVGFQIFITIKHKSIISGSQVVDWLLSWSFVACRSEGTRVGDSLLEHGHLQPVGLKSRNSLTRGSLAETAEINVFCDADNALYRFVSCGCFYGSKACVLDLKRWTLLLEKHYILFCIKWNFINSKWIANFRCAKLFDTSYVTELFEPLICNWA